ncbi:MAG TPA: hypothetical protein VGG81_02190 [Edaphobacter sp.]
MESVASPFASLRRYTPTKPKTLVGQSDGCFAAGFDTVLKSAVAAGIAKNPGAKALPKLQVFRGAKGPTLNPKDKGIDFFGIL